MQELDLFYVLSRISSEFIIKLQDQRSEMTSEINFICF